jgi:hypothetical protein
MSPMIRLILVSSRALCRRPFNILPLIILPLNILKVLLHERPELLQPFLLRGVVCRQLLQVSQRLPNRFGCRSQARLRLRAGASPALGRILVQQRAIQLQFGKFRFHLISVPQPVPAGGHSSDCGVSGDGNHHHQAGSDVGKEFSKARPWIGQAAANARRGWRGLYQRGPDVHLRHRRCLSYSRYRLA